MANNMSSAADALVGAADKAGENTAKSALDSSFSNFQLPSDPSKLGQMYGQVTQGLQQQLAIPSALDRSKKLGDQSAVSAAASMFADSTKQQEIAKTPVADLDKEINRLSEQRWGILPAVLGRTDITDYGAKLNIANKAQSIIDGEINRLNTSRQTMVDAATARATEKTDNLKAQATLLDKQATAAKDDLNSRIELLKTGEGSFHDVVQSALELQRINDAKKKAGSGSGNPFIGTGGAATSDFSPEELKAFDYMLAYGSPPPGIPENTKWYLLSRYSDWKGAGMPRQTGVAPLLSNSMVTDGGSYYDAMGGKLPEPSQPSNNYQDLANARKATAGTALMDMMLGSGQ